MKTLTCSLILAALTTTLVMQAPQSPTAATPASQIPVKPEPCVPLSPIPKHIKIRVPVWLQKQIDKQQAKIGTTIDVGGMISEATAPRPCPTTTVPPPSAPPKIWHPLPDKSVTIRCNPFIDTSNDPDARGPAVALPDAHNFASPTDPNQSEAEIALPALDASTPCAALRVDPKTNKYWAPALKSPPEAGPVPTPSTPKQ
jgi:hypothetical protein